MALQYDIGLDANGDIDISTGVFTIVKSDQTHIQDIIYSNVGFWRNAPFVGVGIENYLMDSSTDQALIQSIKTDASRP